MADDQNELRNIRWTELFSFTHIFKSFKMAIHPSKLLLAFAAITVVFAAGTVMDGIWKIGDQNAFEGEISAYACNRSDQFDRVRKGWEDTRLDRAENLWIGVERETVTLGRYRRHCDVTSEYLTKAFAAGVKKLDKKNKSRSDIKDEIKKGELEWPAVLSEADDAFDLEIERIESVLDVAIDDAKEALDDSKLKDEEKDKAEEELDAAIAAAKVAVTERKVEYRARKLDIEGTPVFGTLVDYEQTCISNAIDAACQGNIFGGMAKYRAMIMGTEGIAARTAAADPLAALPADDRDAIQAAPIDPPGFMYWLLMCYQGLVWLVCRHWLFATIMLAVTLSATALFGGAICRIAAIHAARDEKISIGQALKFSGSKFMSFLIAPLIPIAIILFIGLVLFLGGLLSGVPGLGEVLMGLFLLIAIILGMIAAFLTIGLVAGIGLMYPTIAVEGSDSFDAISRSFSYVFSRPWRAGLYGLVAVVYGAITYMFVRFFVYLSLVTTHTFLKWGIWSGGSSLHADADLLDVVWARPTFNNLFGTFNWDAMGGWEKTWAFAINFWVYVVAAMVAAYLISYAASSLTVIYYLLRRKVDATDLDDVYVEEFEEPATPAVAAAPPVETEASKEETGE